MNKLTQWIIIWLLALNVLWTFLLIKKVEVSAEDTRIGIINRDRENTNNIISEIWVIKALIQNK
jgi:hypothetical protein